MNLEINRDLKKEHRSSKPRAPDDPKRRPEKKSMQKSLCGVRSYESDSLRSVVSTPSDNEQMMTAVTLKAENNRQPQAYFRHKFESGQSEVTVGELEDHTKVLVGSNKQGQNPQLNTSVQKTVNMNRAKPLFGKDFTTYSEHENAAFCQFIGQSDSASYFMKYLENASKESETKTVKEVFPFMNQQADLENYRAMLRRQEALKRDDSQHEEALTPALASLKQAIEELRKKIYEDQYRRVQFKKQLDQLLKSHEEGANHHINESEEFWLWVWLRKLLHAIEEEIEAVSQASDLNNKRS